MTVIWLATTFLAGLNAGILLSGVLEGMYMKSVGLSGYLQMHQPRDRLLRRVMPPLLLALLVLCALSGITAPGTARTWAWAAFVLVLVDALITVRIMVPLNAQLQGFNALTPPPEATAIRERWYALHPIRTALGTLAFVALLLGAGPS